MAFVEITMKILLVGSSINIGPKYQSLDTSDLESTVSVPLFSHTGSLTQASSAVLKD